MDITELDKDIVYLETTTFEDFNDLKEDLSIMKYFSTKFDSFTGIDHIFKGRINGTGIVGYHSEILFPNQYNQNELEENKTLDKTKPYILHLPNGKVTSCFPNNLNVNNLLILILKCYKQAWKEQPPLNSNTTGWTPITFCDQLGIKIKLVTGYEQAIFDAYPMIL